MRAFIQKIWSNLVVFATLISEAQKLRAEMAMRRHGVRFDASGNVIVRPR